MGVSNFEIVAGFIWLHILEFQEHMKQMQLGPEEGNVELFAGFVEDDARFEDFQAYLEEWHSIEGSEAEFILKKIREDG